MSDDNCPFCGKECEVIDKNGVYWLFCKECGYAVPIGTQVNIMLCRGCRKKMLLVDSDPQLGKMWFCNDCRLQYIRKGPGNAFDRTGWSQH